ncbi:MFS transporter [Anaerobacillus sp. MEB173]|uniref:MFS transporter n=1 Tax=Anaerobacillus sp. MEB173 TaxID=3383345 RepID=UPI003F93B3CA
MNKQVKLWTGQYVAILMMAFLFFICLQLLTAGFPAYITEIKNNPAQAGLMTTVFMVAAIVTRPLIGFLIHKVNIKMISILTLIFIAITVGISYGQDSTALLLVLRVLHGIGFGIITTIFSTMATAIIPSHRLGEGIGYYSMATSVGTTLAPMFALSILQFYSYNLMITLSITLTLASLFLCLFVKVPKFTGTNQSTKIVSFKEYAFDKRALLPCILVSMFSFSLGGVISFLRELGKEANIGGSVSLFFLIIAISMVIVRPISGRIFDRLGHKVIIIPGVISGIIGLFLLSITESATSLLIAGVFYGTAYGTIAPTLQAIAVRFVDREKQGTANAMYFSAMDLGVAIGSIGLGVIASFTSYQFIYGFSILSLVGLLFIYSFILLKQNTVQTAVEKVS